MAQLRWHEEGDGLAATVRRPRSVFIVWLLIVGWNSTILFGFGPNDRVLAFLAPVVLAVLAVLTVRAFFLKATISLRSRWLQVKVGPLSTASTEIPIVDIECFSVEIDERGVSRVIVRRQSSKPVALDLPVDGFKVGPNWGREVWFGAAPVAHLRFIVAWLETALAKRRVQLGIPVPSTQPISGQ